MTRRSVLASFNLLVVDPGPGARLHYFVDCHQLARNRAVAERVDVRVLNRQPERGLCWTCVERLVEQAERNDQVTLVGAMAGTVAEAAERMGRRTF